jgi:hypothetical protein
MKRLLFVPIFILFGTALVFSQTDHSKQIKKIREFYTSISTEIEKIEKDEEAAKFSDLAVNELVVNKLNRSWPAVGNYSVVYSFYYKRVGEEHYPDHLVKATIKTQSSARSYYREFVFGNDGKIVFSYDKSEDNPEQRIYFKNGDFLEYRDGSKTTVSKDSAVVKEALKEAGRIKKLFEISIQ